MLLNNVLTYLLIGVLVALAQCVKIEKRSLKSKHYYLKPFHLKSWRPLEKHKYPKVFKTHKYLNEESKFNKDAQHNEEHKQEKQQESVKKMKRYPTSRTFRKPKNHKLNEHKKRQNKSVKYKNKNHNVQKYRQENPVQRGFLDALKNANISVENHVHSYTPKSEIDQSEHHQRLKLKGRKQKSNPVQRGFLDALKNANISVENHVHSYTPKSEIDQSGHQQRLKLKGREQKSNPVQRGFLDALKNANISVENHVHSYTPKSEIDQSGHQQKLKLKGREQKSNPVQRGFLDALKNANISVENHVHSYTPKSDIKTLYKKNTLLAQALQSHNTYAENYMQGPTMKSKTLQPEKMIDVTGSKRDEIYNEGIHLNGGNPIDLAGEIDNNDKNLIPILSRAPALREFHLEDLRDNDEEEKGNDEEGSEYVASTKDDFPAEYDPYYHGQTEEERKRERQEKLKKSASDIHEQHRPSEDRFDIGENKNLDEERQDNSKQEYHNNRDDEGDDRKSHSNHLPPMHGSLDLHDHGFPINSYFPEDVNQRTDKSGRHYTGRKMYSDYKDRHDREDERHDGDEHYSDDDRNDDHHHNRHKYNHHGDTQPPRHEDTDIESPHRYHPHSKEDRDEESNGHDSGSNNFKEDIQNGPDSSDINLERTNHLDYQSLIAAGGRHSGPAVSPAVGMQGFSDKQSLLSLHDGHSGTNGEERDDRVFESVHGDHCIEKRNGICHDNPDEHENEMHDTDGEHENHEEHKHHLTTEEKMIEYQRNPFDPHDIDINDHHDDDEHHHEAIMSPIPQSVLQIGIDPSNHVHYLSKDQHHDLHYDNSLFHAHGHLDNGHEDLTSTQHNPHEQVEGEYAAHAFRISGHDNPHEYEQHEFDHPVHDHNHETSDRGNTDWDHHRDSHEHDGHHTNNYDGHTDWAHEDDHHGEEHHEEEHGGHEDGRVSYEHEHTYPAVAHQAPFTPIFTPPQRELPMFQVGHVHSTDNYHDHHSSGHRRTNTLNTGQVFELRNREKASDMTHFEGQYLTGAIGNQNLLGLSSRDFGIEAEIARKRKLEDDAQSVLNETEILQQLHDNTSDITIMDISNTTLFEATGNNTKGADTANMNNQPAINTTVSLVDSVKTAETGIRKRVIPYYSDTYQQSHDDDVEETMDILD